MGTFLVLDIPKVPSDSTIWELHKSIFGISGIKNLSRLDSRDMCLISHNLDSSPSYHNVQYGNHLFRIVSVIRENKRFQVLKHASCLYQSQNLSQVQD